MPLRAATTAVAAFAALLLPLAAWAGAMTMLLHDSS